MGDNAFITPAVIKWARETAHMALEVAAAKVSVSPDRLAQWEAGDGLPTIRQAELLAKAYQRPFALFFLPAPPLDFQPLQDFRRKSTGALGTASVFMIREIQQRQAWAREFHEESQQPELLFVGRFSIKDSPESVAADMLLELGINPSNYQAVSPMKQWIEKAEAKGIFISRSSFIHSRLTLDSQELQGFVIADKFAPFVFINSEDWDAPQLFTLVHELAHIWINQSGISSEIQSEFHNRDQLHPVELFCNQVAANALMPRASMDRLDRKIFDSAAKVFQISRKFGVSSFAFLVRALNLGKIEPSKYRELKSEADKAFSEFARNEEEKLARNKAEKRRSGDTYLLRANRLGHLFTRFVIDAFRGGFIRPTDASSLLSTPINKFPKLEAFVYQ